MLNTLPREILLAAAGYLVLANLLALLTARVGMEGLDEWRGSDTRLLFLAAMGGWIGAKLGKLMFRRGAQGGGFGLALNLSVLALPVILAIPLLIDRAPGWIAEGVTAWSEYSAAQAAAGEAAADGATTDSTGTAAPEKALPKIFGPSAGTSGGSHKSIKVGG